MYDFFFGLKTQKKNNISCNAAAKDDLNQNTTQTESQIQITILLFKQRGLKKFKLSMRN